jgi:hypothetical protein
MEETNWIRLKAEGSLGQWHMPAGRRVDGSTLCACDQILPSDADAEERAVHFVPANERCPICQGTYDAAARNRT